MGVCCYKAYSPPKHALMMEQLERAGPASLLLDPRKRKAPLATGQEENFLGFRRKAARKTGHPRCRFRGALMLA
ncbi:unnamed protein product [Merluccius merluccius]